MRAGALFVHTIAVMRLFMLKKNNDLIFTFSFFLYCLNCDFIPQNSCFILIIIIHLFIIIIIIIIIVPQRLNHSDCYIHQPEI